MGGVSKEEAMSFSQGDVAWLRTDNLEGGVGALHPCVVVSENTFNDSHDWGILVRGSHTIPARLLREEFVIRHNRENGLDRDTVFGSIVFSAKWDRVTRSPGKVPPAHIRELVSRICEILSV